MLLGLDLDLPYWYILSAISLVLLYWYGTATHNTFKKMGVPYRKPLPFLGNALSIFQRSVTETDMAMLKQFPNRIAGSFLGNTPILDCADVEFIKEVTIKEFPKFTDRRDLFESEDSNIMKYQIFVLKGDHWKHVRALLSPTFTSGKLKQMYPVINNCADKFVSHLRTTSSAPVIIKDYASGFTMDVIASTAFGLDLDTQSSTNHPFVVNAGTFFGIPKKVTWFSKIKLSLVIFCMITCPSILQKFLRKVFGFSFLDEESVEYFYDMVDKVVADRKENSSERRDFISMCIDRLKNLEDVDPGSIRISAKDAKWTTEGLTMDEVSANATGFLSAGYETTATALQFFIYSMTIYPDIQEKLYESICKVSEDGNLSYEQIQKLEYLDFCVSESLRMFPPVLRMDRVAAEEVTIQGITLPKGQVVNILAYAVHHNPLYWDKPEEFQPERFAQENRTDIQQYAYLPFGAGGRGCIAMRLAILEVKVAVAKLLTAFRFEKCADTPQLGCMKFKKFSGFLQPASPLAISAVPRK